MSLFGEVLSTAVLDRSIILDAVNFRKGVTAPSDATISTTPTVPALLFDATNELLDTNIMMPRGAEMDFTVNPRLVLTVSLVNGQVNGDTLDMTLDYVAVREDSTGDGPSKTSTQITGTVTATTANGLAVDDVYTISFTFDRNDANNPINAGTTAIFLEFHLTNVAGVAAIHLLSGCFAYEGAH